MRNGGMEDPTVDAADAPLLFAVEYLIREYRNCISSLQFMLDENRDLFVPLPPITRLHWEYLCLILY